MASLALAAAGLTAAVLIAPTPAHAASDYTAAYLAPCDSLWRDPAGWTAFVDYGPGDPDNPAANDDYIEIRDNCEDRHGVRGYVWLNGVYLGSRYNGRGAQKDVIWDPFGNLPHGSRVGVKVCLVDGPEGSGYACSGLVSHTITEG